MNKAFIPLAAAAVFAIANWIAVAKGNKPLEYAAKPAVMAALIVTALMLDPASEAQRWAFVIALLFSMAGDVLLMLPADRFVGGVASFFLAHVAYIVGLRLIDSSLALLLVGTGLVVVFAATVGRRVLAGVRDSAPAFTLPVSAYMTVISLMVACAIATRDPVAIVGALLFLVSDTLIAWNRFVEILRWAPVTIMVTYHLGQAALVLSLLDR